MYFFLLQLHNAFRWILLIALIYATIRAYRKYTSGKPFTKTDDRWRHWTATISHIQFTIGATIYFISPMVKYFWKNLGESITNIDSLFFGLIHMIFMLTAVGFITTGSSLAKREEGDKEKFRLMWVWFLAGLIVILIAVPWPFSPLAARPYIR